MPRVIPVAGCAIIQEGKLLLLFKKAHKHYEFPGGKVKVGESLRHAAIRETKEETGCDVKIKKYFGCRYIRDKHPRYDYKAHIFLAKLVGRRKPKVMDRDDFRDCRWISVKRHRVFPLAENVKLFCHSYLQMLL